MFSYLYEKKKKKFLKIINLILFIIIFDFSKMMRFIRNDEEDKKIDFLGIFINKLNNQFKSS